MTQQRGVAVLGCGYWGVNHVRVLHELAVCEPLVVCDRRPSRLREVQKRFPGVRPTDDIESVLFADDIDAVVVCTEAATHYDLTSQCLAAGKHALVEKPLTTTASDANALTAMARANGVTLMVAHTFLYNSAVRKVKRYLDDGRIGDLYYLYACRTNLGPIRRDVSALWDLAPHDVAIFNYWLDSVPTWVSAVGSRVLRNAREDVGFISLGYADGVIGHIHVSWVDPQKTRNVVVVGSDRRIVFDDLDRLEPVRIFEKGVRPLAPTHLGRDDAHVQMRDGDIISPRFDVFEPLKTQDEHFLHCVDTGDRPLSSGLEGEQVVAVLAAIHRSIELQGARVEIGAQYDAQIPAATLVRAAR